MSKAKFTALLGAESEDEDLDILAGKPIAHTKKATTMPAAKKGNAAANRATKTAQNTTHQTRAAATAAEGRKPLVEKITNTRAKTAKGRGKKRPAVDEIEVSDAQQEAESIEEDDPKPKVRRGRRTAKAAKLSAEPAEPLVEPEPEPEPQASKRGRNLKAQVVTPPTEVEIPETQPIQALDDSIEEEQPDELPSYENRAVASSIQRQERYAVPFSANRRPVAASDSELSDPALRRRIGELTRKCENLEAKYRDLRDIGVKEAERNYDKLKKQGDERANTANQLIETLKAQLAAQTELAKEGQRLKQQLEASESKVAGLENKITEMTTSLSESKTEIKALSTKLAASRAAEAANAKVPGSAMKGNTANKTQLANAEAAIQVAQMKEDLYADLTGLIVRGVKQNKDEEIYDCIQTGRNGTLHFKLSIRSENTSDFDEAQFMYMPQLDINRDKALIELLPDYLVEEITFPRPHAAKFYARVMKSLTEKPEE